MLPSFCEYVVRLSCVVFCPIQKRRRIGEDHDPSQRSREGPSLSHASNPPG